MSTADSTAYIYATIATIVISALSVCGAALIPCLDKKAFAKVKLFLIALSIGTLLSDAILHLIPQAIGLHGAHGFHNDQHHDALVQQNLTLLPSDDGHATPSNLAAPVAFVPNHKHHTTEDQHSHSTAEEPDRIPQQTRVLDVGQTRRIKRETESHDSHEHSDGHAHDEHAMESDHHEEEHERLPNHMKKLLVVVGAIYGLWVMESLHRFFSGHDHSHFKVSPTDPIALENGYPPVPARRARLLCGLKPAAFSILFGDSLHNLCDGFAIGAAFAIKPTLGVTTSIAVATHELPHELGDFVVLLSSGLTFKWALILNLLSALFAVVGVFPGIALTHVFDDSKGYIFAAVAGMFIYIALVDMSQELLSQSDSATICGTALHNLGFIAGISFMALLAVYEDDIYSSL